VHHNASSPEARLAVDDVRAYLSFWQLGIGGLLLVALVALLWLPLSLLSLLALAFLSGTALVSALILTRSGAGLSRLVVILWGVGVFFALGLTGGLLGSLSLLGVMPLVVALGFRRLDDLILGGSLSLGVTLLATLIGAVVRLKFPDGDEALWLQLMGFFVTLGSLFSLSVLVLQSFWKQTDTAQAAMARYYALLVEQPGLVMSFEAGGLVISAYGTAPKGLEVKTLMSQGLLTCISASDQDVVREAFFFANTEGRARARFTPAAALDRTMTLSLRKAKDGKIYGIVWETTIENAKIDTLESALSEMEKSVSSKSQYLANMSHELRTPLNAVIGFSDMMRQGLFGPMHPKYKEYTQLIWESGQHVLDLINDVLDLSKIEAQRYELRLEAFDLREPVSQALKLMRAQSHEKQIELRGFLPVKPLFVEADKRAIKQMCLNLLSNALKFTPRGGKVELRAKLLKAFVEISVKDNGVGIAAEDEARLGQAFVQSGNAAQKALGTGLGLSIVKAMAQMHGGDMSITSQPGMGTLVKIRLPLKAKGQPDLPGLK
jgi:cell cycle sensor histidine kinase DivJ